MRANALLVPALLALGLLDCGTPAPTAPAGGPAPGGAPAPVPPSAGADAGQGAPSSDASTPFAPSDGSVAPDATTPVDGASPVGPLVAYASGYAQAIDRFAVDESTGALSATGSTPSFGTSPSFLAIDPSATNLYALDENTAGRVGAYAIDRATGALTFLGSVSSGGDGPAFLTVDGSGKYVLVANYGDGTVSVLPVQAGGGVGAPLATLAVGANAHMIVPDPSNRFVFVPCLGADYVAQFVFDAGTGKLTPNATPHVATAAGAGPRHIAFHPNGKLAYLINETNSTITAYAFDPSAGTLGEIETQTTLPAGFTGTNTAAEIWVHPSGAWLFGSNRGDDSIAVFAIDPATGKMTAKGHTKTGGQTPRDFTLDRTGTWLYAANQASGSIVPFRFDASQGTLTAVAAPVTLTSPSFVGLVRLAAP
jgi:6-phosphogluconolactonase